MKSVSQGTQKTTNHLANERTFLAWVRTSIGLMAFGFLVERFALFVKQIGFFFESEGAKGVPIPKVSYSTWFGLIIIIIGAIIGVLAFYSYKKGQQQIEENAYRPSLKLSVSLTILVILLAIFLSFLLLRT